MRKYPPRRLNKPSKIALVLLAAVVFGFLYYAAYTSYLRTNHPRPYADTVADCAVRYGVPEMIIYSVIKTESEFDEDAVSVAGAVGLMQLIPSTFRWLTDYHTAEKLPDGMIYDPATNIRYGTYYLSWLYERYGRWDTALAAYNAGPGRVDGWLADDKYSEDGVSLKSIPYGETRKYVKIVLGSAEVYERLYYRAGGIDSTSTG